MNVEQLCREWSWHKQKEQEAAAARREIEDKLRELLDLPDNFDGTRKLDAGDYHIKAVGRLNRKVDPDALQELARDNGIGFEHLQRLFRWSASINMAAFKAAADDITGPLSPAITTSPGRPSFNIALKES